MNKSLLFLALHFLVAVSALRLFDPPEIRAEIRETRSIVEALGAADESTLVVLDIDNTILEPRQELGSDQWYGAMLRRMVASGQTAAQANQVLVPLWKRINRVTAVRPVEPATPALIRGLQDRHLRVMALTSRHTDYIDPTVGQLRSIGVDFRRSAPSPGDLRLAPTIQYAGGILYVTDGPKGAAFRMFLGASGYRPSKILFVDDKPKHVQDLETTLSELGIPHLEFRYGATDAKVQAFDLAIADLQLQLFGQILSDEAAAALLRAAGPPRARRQVRID